MYQPPIKVHRRDIRRKMELHKFPAARIHRDERQSRTQSSYRDMHAMKIEYIG